MKERYEEVIERNGIVALGAHLFLHSEIDAVYEQNQLAYYRAFRKGKYAEEPLFGTYTMEKEIRMKKVAGIFSLAETNGDDKVIFHLFKKGYKYAWNYVENHQDINIDDFVNSLQNKKQHRSLARSEEEFYHQVISMMYISFKKKRKIQMQTHFGMYFLKVMRERKQIVDVGKLLYTKENLEEKRFELERLDDDYYILRKKERETVQTVLDRIITNEKEAFKPSGELTKEMFEEMREKAFRSGISKYIGAYSTWFKAMGFNEGDLTDSAKVRTEDIDKIFYTYLTVEETNELEGWDEAIFIVSLFFIKALMDEYQKAKTLYFNQLQESYFFEIEEHEKALDEKKAELNKAKSVLDAKDLTNKEIEKENRQLKQELERLQKQNQKLETKVEAMQDLNQEVSALREFVYQQSQEEAEPTSLDADKLSPLLSGRKVAIIGGSISWQKRLREACPDFLFFTAEEASRDIKKLDKMELVVINTATISHAFYGRVMKQLSRNPRRLSYVNGNHNLTISLQRIQEALQ